jgi:hypothetical protein
MPNANLLPRGAQSIGGVAHIMFDPAKMAMVHGTKIMIDLLMQVVRRMVPDEGEAQTIVNIIGFVLHAMINVFSFTGTPKTIEIPNIMI